LASFDLAMIELLSGDPAAAEREVRPECEMLEKIGETFYLSSMAAVLARAVREQGRDGEALEVTRLAEKSAAPNDIDAQVAWRCIRAPILARTGALEEAEALMRAAVDMAKQTEAPDWLASSWSELATVLYLRGQPHEARQALDEALRIYDAKGDRMSAQRLRAAASAA
jgi:ATP/maltotriose-dependent transcriptional regulator MalT